MEPWGNFFGQTDADTEADGKTHRRRSQNSSLDVQNLKVKMNKNCEIGQCDLLQLLAIFIQNFRK